MIVIVVRRNLCLANLGPRTGRQRQDLGVFDVNELAVLGASDVLHRHQVREQ